MVKMSIGNLSKAALKKLQKGSPVRVKAGDALEVEIDVDKAEKLKKAFDQAKGMNLSLNPEEIAKNLEDMTGKGLFAGGGLYAATPTMKGRGKKKSKRLVDQQFSLRDVGDFVKKDIPSVFGKGTRLVDQKFSLRDAADFTTKELPSLFGGGGQLHRNRKDFMIEKGSIGVGGNLLSPFEQPIPMRSAPYSSHYRQASQLPPEFQHLHTSVI
jgi:hypothetical protein